MLRPIIILVLLYLLIVSLVPPEQPVRSSLRQAQNKGLVVLKATTTDSGSRYLRLHFENKSSKTIQLSIEPALIFYTSDTAYQDLVLPGEETISIAPGQPAEVAVPSFCIRGRSLVPQKDIEYKIRKQGDSSLSKVLKFINQNKLYDDLGQRAVWVITDKQPSNTVYDPARQMVAIQLSLLTAKLTHQKGADNFRLYAINNRPGKPAFTGKLTRVFVFVDMELTGTKKLALGLYNRNSQLVQPLIQPRDYPTGKQRIPVSINTENLPPATYYIRVMDGTMVQQQQLINLE